jgi:hypothetical protein
MVVFRHPLLRGSVHPVSVLELAKTRSERVISVTHTRGRAPTPGVNLVSSKMEEIFKEQRFRRAAAGRGTELCHETIHKLERKVLRDI